MTAAIDNMKTRLEYNGGTTQVARMNENKLQSLKKALLYSYQSAIAILSDGREFRCLINPDKIKREYDDKIISIPFEDVCLNKNKNEKTTDAIEKIGLKAGDVFTWKENNTDWIIYQQKLEETAYLRAEIRRCKYELEIGENTYKVYASGPSTEEIEWKKASGITWNNLNYSLVIYVTKNEETEDFFHRFKKVKINKKPWEVQGADSMSFDGIIVVALKEDYSTDIIEQIEVETNTENTEDDIYQEGDIYIDGDPIVFPYDTKTYYIEGSGGGSWSVDHAKVKIEAQDSDSVQIAIATGRSGAFNLIYKKDNTVIAQLAITIESL